MTISAKEKSKASKYFNMFVDNASSDNEKNKAKEMLVKLLQKHKASISDFVDNVDNETAKLFDFSEKQETEVKRNYKLSNNTLKQSNNKKSRRKLIIEMLKQNSFTKREIAQVLTSQYAIADLKQNLKAVSGTIYDLQTHNLASFKIDAETDKVTATFA